MVTNRESKMRLQKWPRHYAAEIMLLDEGARAEALAAVPEQFRDLVAKHIEITVGLLAMARGNRHTLPTPKQKPRSRHQIRQGAV